MLNWKYVRLAGYNILLKAFNLLDAIKYMLLPKSISLLYSITENFVLQRCIFIAAELEITKKLKMGSLHIDKLSADTDTNPLALYRIMRALASKGIFKEISNKTFINTRLSRALEKESSGSIVSWLRYFGSEWHQNQWEYLMLSVKNGNSATVNQFNLSHFEWLEKNSNHHKIFNDGIEDVSKLVNNTLVSSYNFDGIKKIIDIGGGSGSLLSTILIENKEITGTLFELPEVIEQSKLRIKKLNSEVLNRILFISGNFFDLDIEEGDLYILKSVLHDWADEDVLKILTSCHNRMSTKTKLLIIEILIVENNRPQIGKLLDIAMLVLSGGQERTLSEYKNLLQKANLTIARVISTSSPFSILEIKKI